jgi:hypothetical protein
VVYLFPSFIGIKRNFKQFLEKPRSEARRMDLFWGGADWRDVPPAGRAVARSEDEPAGARTWVEAFSGKAAGLGLRAGRKVPLISNDQGSRMYHLLFFSHHEAGLRIWANITRIEASGQRALL